MVLLQALNVKKSVLVGDNHTLILRDVSLTLERKESIAITGKSGSGKTTLLHILGGLDSLDSGKVIFKGKVLQDIDISNLHKYNIGFIFQNFYLLEDDTVLRNILMPALIARKPLDKKSKSFKRAEYLLDLVGLSEKKKVLARNLSGGEKQRISIARALMNEPDVILADEPTGNLDIETSKYIHDLLLNCVFLEKISLIVVTHNDSLAQMCSKRFILQDKLLKLI